ncbi:MAG: rRNA pseudouridine synthase [Deltaproteobacteria bacterium]|jgi:23S rRNA pseudouridine2605 synthase|nr:MAG: rRNA pseudouridine synthase [Deltaproteobacteria bacterium]
MKERLQKIIAKAGIASRRQAENLIRDGMVRVNGIVVTELGSKADPAEDSIEVNGKPITNLEPKVYIVLNKPKGYVTTLKDPQKRPIVTDLLKDIKSRVFPVGRLDYNTEGLLLFTNDGDVTQRLIHPRNKVLKTYLVEMHGMLTSGEINKLESGIELDDGVTAPAKLKFIKKIKDKSWWEISIHEGKKRQIKRMFEGIGHSIYQLRRIRFGPLELRELAPGKYRFLTDQEIRELVVSA